MARFKKKKALPKPSTVKNTPTVDRITGQTIPKSFVFSRGKLGLPGDLELDLRKLMLPHTTLKLKIVLSGFGSGDQHLKLTRIMFQNIFSAIDINTVKLSSCRRIILLSHNNETNLIDFQHYSIRLQPIGLAMVQKVKLMKNRQLSLASDLDRVNRASTQSAVRLQEIGPRMTLHLVKVEEGLCSGAVIYNDFEAMNCHLPFQIVGTNQSVDVFHEKHLYLLLPEPKGRNPLSMKSNP
ncbi:hypothetical protein C4D60_Mb05t01040 [Musa balbisiana]|uniref:Brix domain-containing protein n=1 Tax=Musa balbisiana TaxID=52838 RepID=A0A4S8JST1_MUSBA|nr:hypothetical protein C4D60_Mb05t01040 [Musa balbisiana]